MGNCSAIENGKGFGVQGSGFRVCPGDVLSLACLRKRGSGFYRFKRFKVVGVAHKKQKHRGV